MKLVSCFVNKEPNLSTTAVFLDSKGGYHVSILWRKRGVAGIVWTTDVMYDYTPSSLLDFLRRWVGQHGAAPPSRQDTIIMRRFMSKEGTSALRDIAGS